MDWISNKIASGKIPASLLKLCRHGTFLKIPEEDYEGPNLELDEVGLVDNRPSTN